MKWTELTWTKWCELNSTGVNKVLWAELKWWEQNEAKMMWSELKWTEWFEPNWPEQDVEDWTEMIWPEVDWCDVNLTKWREMNGSRVNDVLWTEPNWCDLNWSEVSWNELHPSELDFCRTRTSSCSVQGRVPVGDVEEAVPCAARVDHSLGVDKDGVRAGTPLPQGRLATPQGPVVRPCS